MILPKGIEAEVRLLLSQNKKVAAVKLVHTALKCGLKEALDIVENIGRGQTVPVGNARDTQIDKILADQGLKQVRSGSVGTRSLFGKILFFMIILAAIVFFLIYLF